MLDGGFFAFCISYTCVPNTWICTPLKRYQNRKVILSDLRKMRGTVGEGRFARGGGLPSRADLYVSSQNGFIFVPRAALGFQNSPILVPKLDQKTPKF